MRKLFSTIGVVVSIALLACLASSVGADEPRITLLNPPPDGGLKLTVGQSYTFEIEVAEGEPFVLSMAMPDAYYPGRSIIWRGNDIAQRDTSALLQLTMIATSPTEDLAQVCGWPDPDTPCWPNGVAPVSIVAGVRFEKGVVLSERFDFSVRVLEP